VARASRPHTLRKLEAEAASALRNYGGEMAGAYGADAAQMPNASKVKSFIEAHPIISGVLAGFLLSRLT
jgi:hypothetical protein